MDVEEKLSIINPSGEAPQFITMERRWERVDGGSLVALIAHSPDPNIPDVRWENPFLSDIKGHGVQWHDDEIGVANCLMSLINAIRTDSEPTYGPQQSRLDQELILAIRASAEENGLPINIPLNEKYYKL
jgi:hypothetical protein